MPAELTGRVAEHDGITRIFVGVHGSVSSLHALRRAVTEARLRDAVVYSVLAWMPPGGDSVDRRFPSQSLRRIWTADATRRLRTAWQEALGGVPDDIPARLLVERGQPGWVLTSLADREDDLLVVGGGGSGPLTGALRQPTRRYCATRAHCPVLVVPRPPLARALAQVRLPTSVRHLRTPNPPKNPT